MHHLRLIYLALITGLLIGCEETTPPPEDINAWLPLRVGTVDIVAQIAISPAEQQKGLMYRKSLPENGGMLFPYPTPRELSFWMANTPLPLDIGFFDAQGTLREIHRLMPYDTNPVRSRGQNLQFALEMPQGWFAKHGLFQGQRLDMKLLREAMARRGAKPAEFGL
jgi:uncharacterized membrane protein (UPF0127 family)